MLIILGTSSSQMVCIRSSEMHSFSKSRPLNFIYWIISYQMQLSTTMEQLLQYGHPLSWCAFLSLESYSLTFLFFLLQLILIFELSILSWLWLCDFAYRFTSWTSRFGMPYSPPCTGVSSEPLIVLVRYKLYLYFYIWFSGPLILPCKQLFSL